MLKRGLPVDFFLLLFAIIIVIISGPAAVALESSPSWECPQTCVCAAGRLECSHGHRGFPNVSTGNGLVNFEFSNCLLEPELTAVPYPTAQALIINNCALSSIGPGAFVPMSASLRVLVVTGNRLTDVAAAAFQELFNLTDLDLSWNALQSLPDGVFDKLASLSRLDLSGNPLRALGDGLFSGGEVAPPVTLSLNDFSCNDCGLDAIPSTALARLPQLRELQLSRNNFPSIGGGPFARMSHLRTLSLDSCRVWDLTVGAFAGLEASLVSLRLGHNQLTTINEGAGFADMRMLANLELQNNKLTSLSRMTSSPPSTTTFWSQLTGVHLADNPWNCKCDVVWMLQLRTVEDRDKVVCSSPNTFRGRRLFDLTATELCPSTHVVTSNSSLLAVVGITTSISIICVVLLAVVCKQCLQFILRRQRRAVDESYVHLKESSPVNNA